MSLKLLGKNTIVYAIGNGSMRAASFLLIPLYTHYLSVEDYGLLVTLLVSVQVLIAFMSMGMWDTLVRFAQEYESKNLIGALLGTSILINVAAGLGVTLICVLFIMPVSRAILHTNSVSTYIVLSCCVALAQSLCLLIMSYYRARSEPRKFMVAALLSTFLLVALNLTFVRLFHLGVKGVLIAQAISYSIMCILMALSILPQTRIRVSFPLMRTLLRFGSPLVLSVACWFVMESSALYFLSHFCGLEHVAIYSLSYKFASIIGIVLILPFQLAFPPFVFANLDNPKIRETLSRVLTYLVAGSVFVAFLVLFGSRFLIPVLAPPEYALSYIVLVLLIPAFVFQGLLAFGQTLLHINKKSHITASVAAAFAILNLIVNYVAVPMYGYYGAILATDATFVLVGLATFMLGLKEYPVPLETRRLLQSGGILIFLCLMFLVLQDALPCRFCIGTTLSACLGVLILVRSRFFTHEEIRAITNLILRLRQMKRAV